MIYYQPLYIYVTYFPGPFRFPILDTTAGEVQLSLVVPSYNEEKRLPSMMVTTMKYLEQRAAADPAFTYEVVIVDDGSKDATYQV